jgi:hypothetical protein
MEAFKFLNHVEFEQKDVPLLQQVLLKQYLSPYDGDEADDINLRLVMKLGRLKDTGTIAFIKENYPALPKEKEYLKKALLGVLAELQTTASYKALAQLLQQYSAPAKALDYQILQSLKDSMALTAPIFPTIQTLAKNSANGPMLANLALALLDSGYIKQEQLAVAQDDYISSAQKLLPDVKKGTNQYFTTADLLKLIGSFNTATGNGVLKSYLTAYDPYIKKDAAIQLIKNKQPVPAPVLLKLAANEEIRSILYLELKDLKQTALFPKQYATQQYFAEAAIHAAASDDYTVLKMTFLAKKTATYKGKPYVFYLYRVVLEDDDAAGYLGIAGGYKPGSDSLTTAENLSNIYWYETYSAGKINSFFKNFLKNSEKENQGD